MTLLQTMDDDFYFQFDEYNKMTLNILTIIKRETNKLKTHNPIYRI